MKKKSVTICFGLALLFLQPFAAAAHEDLKLEAALAADPVETGRRYQKAALLSQLANLYLEVGDKEKAQRLITESKETEQGIRDAYVRQYVAGHTANEVGSGGDFDRALRMLNSIDDTEIWVKTAWKLAAKMAKAGQKEGTRRLLRECEDRAHRVKDLLLRSELLSGTGAGYRYLDKAEGVALVYEAYGIAQSLSDPYDRAIMFNEAGAHLMDIGHKVRALAVFDEVARLVGEIGDPLKQAKALAMLGGEQAEKGERDRAAQALEQGIKIAETLPPGEEAFAVQSEIARNFGQSHRFERGIAVAEKISDPYHRAEGFIRIAKNMHRMKQEQEAKALLERTVALSKEIKDPYLQAIVLRKLASEYLHFKENDRALGLLDRAMATGGSLAANRAFPSEAVR